MALETTASIISNLDSNLPTNNAGQITAELLRNELKRIANNMRQSVEDIILVNPSDETDKTVFKRQDIKDLKLGKSIADGDAATAGKSLTHPGDENTFIKQKSNAPGRVDHVVSNKVLLQMTTGSFIIGNSVEKDTPIKLVGNTLSMDGETSITGSTIVSGSFTVTDLLTVLADYGQTGSFGVSGSSTFQGDVNMDGNVNVQDLLTVLSGFNASGSNSITGSVEISGSTTISGSMEIEGNVVHSGTTNTLPPPSNVSIPPSQHTRYYQYLYSEENFAGVFTGGQPATASYAFFNPSSDGPNDRDPNNIARISFSSASQTSFFDQTPSSSFSFLEEFIVSASIHQKRSITFVPYEPSESHPLWSYKWETYGSIYDSANKTFFAFNNLIFKESSSLDPVNHPVPRLLPTGSSYVNAQSVTPNGRFYFFEEGLNNGGYNVGDVMNVLANYGQVGVPAGTLGDLNFDGMVNFGDLLMVLAGYGNPNNICTDVFLTPNTNHQFVGPFIRICEGHFLIIPDNTFCSIT